MATALRQQPPPTLTPSTSINPLTLAAQVPFASTSTLPYVLHVVPLSSSRYLLAGSDDTLRIFSATLEPLGILPSKQKGITSLVKGSGESSEAVFVTSRDGVVTGWDSRDLSKEAFRFKGEYFRIRRRSYI